MQPRVPAGTRRSSFRTRDGVNLVSFGAIKGDGAGQTIAVIDAFDNPSFVDTGSPGFATRPHWECLIPSSAYQLRPAS